MISRASHRVLLSSLCLLLLLSGWGRVSCFDVTILHTNDVHAHVAETEEDSSTCDDGPCIAGVARRFTKVSEIRRNEENVLLLDAGDQFQGTVWFNFYKGAEAAEFMNRLGYDAMALGNHEFDNGVDSLIEPFLRNVKFSVLSANMKADETLAPQINSLYQPYKIFNMGSERVAVVGYTIPETPFLSSSGEHLTFDDEVETLNGQVAELQALGINKIIALGHSGFEKDKDIARRVAGIDVVVGGHTNTFLYTGTPPSTEVPEGLYPFIVTSDDGRNVPVVHAYAFGKYLGNLKVTFDDSGNVVTAAGNPILLDNSITQDPGVLAEVEVWRSNLTQFSLQIVGRTLVLLNGTKAACRYGDCTMGNMICDAMVHTYIHYSSEPGWSTVAVAMLNAGGIRKTIEEVEDNGAVSMEDVLNVLPFENTFDLLVIRGSTMLKILEHSIAAFEEESGQFLQVSGLRVVYDISKPVNQRVVSVLVLCTECREPKYEALDVQRNYSVVMISYIAEGGDDYLMIPEEKLSHEKGDTDAIVLAEYMTDIKIAFPAVENRIVVRDSAVFPAHGLGLLLLSLCLNL